MCSAMMNQNLILLARRISSIYTKEIIRYTEISLYFKQANNSDDSVMILECFGYEQDAYWVL